MHGQEGCSECTSLANSCCFPADHGHFLDNRSVATLLPILGPLCMEQGTVASLYVAVACISFELVALFEKATGAWVT